MCDKPEEFKKNEDLQDKNTMLNEADSKTIDLIKEEVKERLKTQSEFQDHLDSKTGVMLGAIGLILTIVIGFQVQYSTNPAYLVSVTLFVISFFCAIASYVPRGFFVGPESRELKKYFFEENKVLKEKLIDHYIIAFEKNKPILHNKKTFFYLYFIIFIIALVILFIGMTPAYVNVIHLNNS